MSYKRKFTNQHGALSPISGAATGNWNSDAGMNQTPTGGWNNDFAFRNYQSRLPEVYTGHPNRIERYNQYEMMDVDPEINMSLNILSEFSSQANKHNNTPFTIEFREKPTDHEVDLVKKQLQQWTKLNELDSRIFKMFRNVLKYGDQVFLRDPENFKLYWIDMTKVVKVIVNESEGKLPEQYVIKDININLQNLTVAEKTTTDFQAQPPTAGYSAPYSYTVPNEPYGTTGSRFSLGVNESAIDAKHVVHLSLTEGLDRYWPFGQSILEMVFKTYKQKELLEDAILIYRISRAPERRIFKIDVGNMPSHMAMSYINRVKDEIHQRRIPSVQGGQSVMDATYNPLCLDLTTRIPLLDGRTLMLSELITEFDQGKENWAYSCDPETGRVVPGLINWAGITRRNTETIKLTFDNGNTLICTPDHKIPVFGKGFIEAQHLTEDDSLIAFNTREHNIAGANTSQYQQVWDHEYKQWIFTHRMVGNFFKSKNKHQEFCYLPENANLSRDTIHHLDYDRFNNDPRNLTFMNKQDHILFHASKTKEFWETMTPEYRKELTGKIAETVRNNWANMTEDQRTVALWNIRAAQQKVVWMRKNDSTFAAKYAESMRQARKEYFERCPDGLVQVKKNMEKRVKIKNQALNVTFDMLQCVANIVRSGEKNKNRVLELCDKHKRLMELVRQENSTTLDYKNAQCKIDFTKFGYSKMDRLLSKFGYKNWKHFVSEIDNFNHRVVKIERVENRDTGTITIDGLERWHGYHTFAIESGIFVKNSINEDYFFPVTADGRGSSIDTLPGGQNLGEIDDLRYFNNKLARGLGIPSSYLPTGPDDSERAFTDGKVGNSLIQEFRFNQYCLRLQNYIIRKLDDEFKMFLRWRGFNIDSGLFDIKFNEPQNFASYRQAELDTARVGTFQTVASLPYMSVRFAMKRFLGLTEEEIAENEAMWQEERQEPEEMYPEAGDLRSVGISSGDIQGDLDTADQIEADLQGGPDEQLPPETIAPVAPPPTGVGTAGEPGQPPL